MTHQISCPRGSGLVAVACLLGLGLSACGGGGGSDGSVSTAASVSASVPDSTFSSSQAFMAYELSLKPSDTTEPLLIGNHTAPTDTPAAAVPLTL